jgi:hypothetical protein
MPGSGSTSHFGGGGGRLPGEREEERRGGAYAGFSNRKGACRNRAEKRKEAGRGGREWSLVM